MLETLYGCGLRVSELVSLKYLICSLRRFIKITGKGNKQRFVPIGSWLRNTSIFIKAPLDSSERKERAW
jgi:integrase/recombinase XerD